MSAQLTVAVPRELDENNRQSFTEKVLALPVTPYLVALDCNGTTRINSVGLGTLVKLSKKLRDRGQCLIVRGLSEDLLALFDLCHLRTLLCDFDPEARRTALRDLACEEIGVVRPPVPEKSIVGMLMDGGLPQAIAQDMARRIYESYPR